MINKIVAVALVLGLIFFPVFSVKASDLTNTENFLKTNYNSLDPDTQDWMAMGLGSVGVSVSVTKTSSTAVLDLARNALAFDAQGQNPQAQISALENSYSNGQFGPDGAINNDVFSLLAIEDSDSSWVSAHPEAFQTLINNQNSNGSFDFSAGGSGDVDITAAAIWTLRSDSTSAGSNSVNKAFSYVNATQNSDGGFPFLPGESSDVASTSWALLAYQSLGKTNQQAVNYLTTTMQSNGAWLVNGTSDNLNTAYALMALSGQGMPITFKQPTTQPTTNQPGSGNGNPSTPNSPTTATPSTTKTPSSSQPAGSSNPTPISGSENNPIISSKKPVTITIKKVTVIRTITTPIPSSIACTSSASAQASAQSANGVSSSSSSANAQASCN